MPQTPVLNRRTYISRIYQHLPNFYALMEDGHMDFAGVVALPDGEEVCVRDLMTGLDTLTEPQRQAFDLVHLQGYGKKEAIAAVCPQTPHSNSVQKNANAALDKMIAALDGDGHG